MSKWIKATWPIDFKNTQWARNDRYGYEIRWRPSGEKPGGYLVTVMNRSSATLTFHFILTNKVGKLRQKISELTRACGPQSQFEFSIRQMSTDMRVNYSWIVGEVAKTG